MGRLVRTRCSRVPGAGSSGGASNGLYQVATAGLSAPEIALLALLEVVLGPLWAWLGAGEAPAVATLAGGALVIAALLLNELAALGVRIHARRVS